MVTMIQKNNYFRPSLHPMKSFLIRIFRIFLTVILLAFLVTGGFLIYSSLQEFRPDSFEKLRITGKDSAQIGSKREFSFLIWNVGYAGLGEGMDFFYDGGEMVRPSRREFDRNFEQIKGFLIQQDTVDFILLQEADSCSKRSYYINEIGEIASLLPEYSYSFGINYYCRFVPVPIFSPMGKVVSGIATFSVYHPLVATRIGFDHTIPWPKRLYFMKRCFVVTRFRLPDNKEFLVVNIHNSAYDTGGIFRREEMENLSVSLRSEYEKGNYIVAGGDWNANPPRYKSRKIITGDKTKADKFIPLDSFFPGWNFAYDLFFPTNRDVDKPYKKGITPTTIIDFFLVSPNVEVLAVSTFSTLFKESDHQPVYLKISLKQIP